DHTHALMTECKVALPVGISGIGFGEPVDNGERCLVAVERGRPSMTASRGYPARSKRWRDKIRAASGPRPGPALGHVGTQQRPFGGGKYGVGGVRRSATDRGVDPRRAALQARALASLTVSGPSRNIRGLLARAQAIADWISSSRDRSLQYQYVRRS